MDKLIITVSNNGKEPYHQFRTESIVIESNVNNLFDGNNSRYYVHQFNIDVSQCFEKFVDFYAENEYFNLDVEITSDNKIFRSKEMKVGNNERGYFIFDYNNKVLQISINGNFVK